MKSAYNFVIARNVDELNAFREYCMDNGKGDPYSWTSPKFPIGISVFDERAGLD